MSRAEQSAATRKRILAIAWNHFPAEGSEPAKIRAIASEAGVTTGAVFCHWSGKAELYRAVYGHWPITPEQGRELLMITRRSNLSGLQDHMALLRVQKEIIT